MRSAHPYFITGEIYRRSSYGRGHPLSIPRVSVVTDLVRALGWVDGGRERDSPQASFKQLTTFHDPDYVAAVMAAEAAQSVSEADRRRYGLGDNGNPVFPEMFRRPATACGGSLLAAELVAAGGVAYNPAGGTHHGRRARAHGFCYFNDPVLAILALLHQGVRRVYYVDLDVHHADGVQAAFAGDHRVLSVSVHQEDIWPRSGALDDVGGGMARNLPVARGMNDTEMAYICETLLLTLGDRFAPEAVVVQAGCDALADDPIGGQRLSNGALWAAVAALKTLAPRLIVLGGGGYNPYAVGRCWAGIWAVLDGRPVPERLPAAARAVLRAISWKHRRGRNPPARWFDRLHDEPHFDTIRPETKKRVTSLLSMGL